MITLDEFATTLLFLSSLVELFLETIGLSLSSTPRVREVTLLKSRRGGSGVDLRVDSTGPVELHLEFQE